MEEDLRLELFTVAEVRDWLVHGNAVRGLSDEIISRTRAWAIVNSPYAKDETYIISAIFMNNEVAAYTACFPDKMRRPFEMLVYWCTTLYVSPKFEGRGFASIVLGQFVEIYGDCFFDLDAAAASQENLRFVGLTVEEIKQYQVIKKPRRKVPFLPQKIANVLANRQERRIKQSILNSLVSREFRLEYVTYVDDELYAFIEAHSSQDAFLRSQSIFNWMLRFPLRQECPLTHRIATGKYFAGDYATFKVYGVKCFVNNQLVGFYVLRNSTDDMAVKYLYYDIAYQDVLFASIAEHLMKWENYIFVTHNHKLAEYISKEINVYQTNIIENIAFSHPQSYFYDKNLVIQCGDGDMLT